MKWVLRLFGVTLVSFLFFTIAVQLFNNKEKVKVILRVKMDKPDKLQLFWSYKENKFSEENSKTVPVAGFDKWQNVTFQLPTDSIKFIRLDLGGENLPLNVYIESISFNRGDKNIIIEGNILSKFFAFTPDCNYNSLESRIYVNKFATDALSDPFMTGNIISLIKEVPKTVDLIIWIYTVVFFISIFFIDTLK